MCETQPTSNSAQTTLRFGCRSKTPEKIRCPMKRCAGACRVANPSGSVRGSCSRGPSKCVRCSPCVALVCTFRTMPVSSAAWKIVPRLVVAAVLNAGRQLRRLEAQLRVLVDILDGLFHVEHAEQRDSNEALR